MRAVTGAATTLDVVACGPAVVTDLGRLRGPAQGLSVNGALDQASAAAANVLVGNDPGAPLLELTALGGSFAPRGDVALAVTGAGTTATVDGSPVPLRRAVVVRAGQRLALTPPRDGLRLYVAVAGGFDAELLLGSCAPDTMTGFGRHVRAGQTLDLRAGAPADPADLATGVTAPPRDVPTTDDGEVVLDVVDGPDVAEFDGGAALLERDPYVLSPRSNHVGLRLGGAVPRRTVQREVLSRGVPVGAVEVPAGDELLVLMRGRGITAGYPVLAVLSTGAQDVAAQLRPGQRVRFRRTGVDDARAALLARAAALDALRRSVSDALPARPVEGATA